MWDDWHAMVSCLKPLAQSPANQVSRIGRPADTAFLLVFMGTRGHNTSWCGAVFLFLFIIFRYLRMCFPTSFLVYFGHISFWFEHVKQIDKTVDMTKVHIQFIHHIYLNHIFKREEGWYRRCKGNSDMPLLIKFSVSVYTLNIFTHQWLTIHLIMFLFMHVINACINMTKLK